MLVYFSLFFTQEWEKHSPLNAIISSVCVLQISAECTVLLAEGDSVTY